MHTAPGAAARRMSALALSTMLIGSPHAPGFAQQERAGSSRIVGIAVDHDTGSTLEAVAITLPRAGRRP